MRAKTAPTIQKQPIQIYKVSYQIKLADSSASGGADPPPAENLTPETYTTF